MKKYYVLVFVLLLLVFQMSAFAQDTIVQWTFPTESALADGGIIASNLDREIETAGGTSDIQFKNGASSKAAQATQWNDGADQKKWRVDFETSGYQNLLLSSKISSGGQNPGPRDFKVQYRVGDGEWTDVPGSEFHVANNWSTGSLVNMSIPNICDDQPLIKLRWIMTSDTASDGNIVAQNGISKIDDIYITGDIINGNEEISIEPIISVYPNPAVDWLIIETKEKSKINICNLQGQILISDESKGVNKLDVHMYKPGLYIVSVVTKKGEFQSQRFVIK